MGTLTRRHVKDLASCFLACRFPLEEDEQDGCRQFAGQLPLTNIVFEAKDESRSRRMGKRASRKVGKKRRRRRDQNAVGGPLEGGDISSSSWTLFKDDNYIVFCFKEDIGGKLDDGGEVVRGHGKLQGSNERSITSQGVPTTTFPHSPNPKEEEEGGEVELELYSSDGDKRSRKSVTSNETSECSQSDTSTASFSFPVLGQEWSGSPAQMPKPAEELLLMEDKIWPSGFQCCRFRYKE